MLTEHTKAVHAQLVDMIKNLGRWLCYFFLEFSNDFEDVIVAKDSVHSDDDLSHDNKHIFLYLQIYSFKEFLTCYSNWLKAVDYYVQKNVVHTLRVLDSWIW